MALAFFDWIIIAGYLLFAFGVGLFIRERAASSRESFFLADRSLPWWIAGTSIAATTFAADTPLAITGIMARDGMSGNWMWMAWMGVHAGVVVLFARMWRESRVLTDAELVQIRYSGKAVKPLRLTRAAVYGLVYNVIILGWVLRAMGKIVQPYFQWESWFPGLVGALEAVWPSQASLATPGEGLTVFLLIGIVVLYSVLGGIRGVMLTDLVQLALALIGSIWLAVLAWEAAGGRSGIAVSLTELYGTDHAYFELFPRAGTGWLANLEMGLLMVGLFLFVQSFANIPSDGGGYLMQRLGSCKTARQAQGAALLFYLLQYLVRIWPWIVVAVAALVLIPIGQEATALNGLAMEVEGDREMAYPVLMGVLLPAGALGLLVTSLLAAFMSTIDTHLNWGSSYVVNDVLLKLRPQASRAEQIWVARAAVAGFALLAILVCFQIDTIEQAWKWVAMIGASLGLPTALRWIWWRVNAPAELLAMGFGLTTAFVLQFNDIAYPWQMILTCVASLAGMLLGIFGAARTSEVTLTQFQEKVEPAGFWPGRSPAQALRSLARPAAGYVALVGATILCLQGGLWLLFG